jgi:hypothetical protein
MQHKSTLCIPQKMEKRVFISLHAMKIVCIDLISAVSVNIARYRYPLNGNRYIGSR